MQWVLLLGYYVRVYTASAFQAMRMKQTARRRLRQNFCKPIYAFQKSFITVCLERLQVARHRASNRRCVARFVFNLYDEANAIAEEGKWSAAHSR